VRDTFLYRKLYKNIIKVTKLTANVLINRYSSGSKNLVIFFLTNGFNVHESISSKSKAYFIIYIYNIIKII
jgi:hypothetical protein